MLQMYIRYNHKNKTLKTTITTTIFHRSIHIFIDSTSGSTNGGNMTLKLGGHQLSTSVIHFNGFKTQ